MMDSDDDDVMALLEAPPKKPPKKKRVKKVKDRMKTVQTDQDSPNTNLKKLITDDTHKNALTSIEKKGVSFLASDASMDGYVKNKVTKFNARYACLQGSDCQQLLCS